MKLMTKISLVLLVLWPSSTVFAGNKLSKIGAFLLKSKPIVRYRYPRSRVITERVCTTPTVTLRPEVTIKTMRIGNERFSIVYSQPVVAYRPVITQTCTERTTIRRSSSTSRLYTSTRRPTRSCTTNRSSDRSRRYDRDHRDRDRRRSSHSDRSRSSRHSSRDRDDNRMRIRVRTR